MANICTTTITFNSNEEGINWLESQIKDLRETKYEERVTKFRDLLGKPDVESYTDAMGAKWVDFGGIWEREGKNSYTLQTESAWYYPDGMIQNIVSKLSEFEPTSNASGRYWDETYSPIGIFECNSEGIKNDETSVEEDVEEWQEENPDGNFWDELVEIYFNDLYID